MNDHTKLWVEALRSGKYEQTGGTLRNAETNAYCCLGIACEVYREAIGGQWKNDWFAPEGHDESGGYLPNPVRVWLGVATESGGFGGTSLASLNDDGNTFDEIADVIESEPEGLFT